MSGNVQKMSLTYEFWHHIIPIFPMLKKCARQISYVHEMSPALLSNNYYFHLCQKIATANVKEMCLKCHVSWLQGMCLKFHVSWFRKCA